MNTPGKIPGSSPRHLYLTEVDPVSVELRNLRVSINTAPSWWEPATYPGLVAAKLSTAPIVKQLLQNVTTKIRPGTLTAIMGGSGSGKTTLLNVMAKRVASWRLYQDGIITFNGHHDVYSINHAYVMQQDILLPTLTVRETLQYSAALRLPPTTSVEDQRKVVEEVILELGLKECADTPIGDNRHRGCSGGEKRRVSIGIQLLANPSVLFLDEPTTGLDATSAYQIIRTLKVLAQEGRTIITTLHQPRSEIWDCFDDIIVLSKGSPVYAGPLSGCLPWFQAQGLPLPPFINPAEFVIDVSGVDLRTIDLERESTVRVESLKRAWNAEIQKAFECTAATTCQKRKQLKDTSKGFVRARFSRQVRVLTERTIKVTCRDPMGMTAALLEAVIMGIATGYINHNLGRDETGIRSREGAVYMAAAMQGYLILIFETYRMSLDISVFDRESAENCVDPLPFILSRRLARSLTEDIPVPLIFSVVFYFIAGFDADARKFFVFFTITLINHYVSVTCAMTCVVASRDFSNASLIANLASTLQSLAGGMFVQSNTIPVYLRWTKWITFAFYAFGAYAGNEFQGNFYDCPHPGGISNPACVQYTGEYVMESLGFPEDWVWRPMVILSSFIVMFLLLSVLGLHFFKVQMAIARTYASSVEIPPGRAIINAQDPAGTRTINVGLEDFSLDLEYRATLRSGRRTKTILHPISATFPSGLLNVIMGPSGSGKSSLLDAMVHRLRNSTRTRFRLSGSLTFNGAVPSKSVIRSLCSYVHQEDDALLPCLTVRESLRFAAGLRLPSSMSLGEKHRRADEVLLQMGLRDCADNLIGSHSIKGISGGEKRRVSIGIQVLTSPRVLVLDEPTSGLDAFTANSILEMLRGLASEGRTIILSIHQVRSNSFDYFGNLLLLARGGQPVYCGAASGMLAYFSRYGHTCPLHTNPADFALDAITIDLQHEDREAVSKARVQNLIDKWKTREIEIEEDVDGKQVVEITSSFSIPCKPSRKASITLPAELGASVRKRVSFSTALPLLIRRGIINTYRQPHLIIARMGQFIGLAVLTALFFAPMHTDFYAVQNRIGFLQEVASLYVIGIIQNTAVYPDERDVFYQEDDDGLYSVEAFLVSYMIIEVPLEAICAMICGMLFVTAVGLPQTATMYFVSVLSCFGLVSCGESVGIIFNTFFGHTGFAFSLMSVVLSIAIAMSGVLAIDMPPLFKAFNYLAPTRYTTRVVALYSLHDLDFTCTDQQRLPDGSCPINTGEDVLRLYHFDESPTANLAGLAGCIIIYRILAWILLKVNRSRWVNG
ncbi:P-loop containing nucleoside triphosphate hydrolase protein [Xylariales sp. PMI_506]|nr:P-loop containing nucleoside triphosphate hydrolase protein [Xylariales sp. PMI_506]